MVFMRVRAFLGLVLVILVGCGDAGGAGDPAPPSGPGGSGGGGSGGVGGVGGVGGQGGSTCDPTKDADGDGIADFWEGEEDRDKDGKPNKLDDDSDGDGWTDKQESGTLDPCVKPVDTDEDGTPDYLDLDSDNDGVPDQDERAYDPDGSKGCRVKENCDDDQDEGGQPIIDLIEVAAGSDPTDPSSKPPDATLYFILPYKTPEKTKDFAFSTGVKDADIYFLIDTTQSMGGAIKNIKDSLDSKIIPTILNGDPDAKPAIPAIPGAWVGVGDFRDIPWAPYGEPGADPEDLDAPDRDWVYRNSYSIGGKTVLGNVAPPEGAAPSFKAPAAVKSILDVLEAKNGGDAPESTGQALWIAATGLPYKVTLGGLWSSKPRSCPDALSVGTPCFRPDKLPIFVIVTDAAFHNGPNPANDYDNACATPSCVGGAVSYQQTVDALNAINAKIVGVTVNTGAAGTARADLDNLATKTGSVYYDPSFGGSERTLVTSKDSESGEVSTEVVRLIGRLAGQGINNVTTRRENYDCPGAVDCNGDKKPDPEYHNPAYPDPGPPFDASKLITKIVPVPSDPPTYASLDETTFYGVRGDATVTFRVHAQNDLVNPGTLMVMRARIQVQTPGGQALGGPAGVKLVYFVIPRDPGAIIKLEKDLPMLPRTSLSRLLAVLALPLLLACGDDPPSEIVTPAAGAAGSAGKAGGGASGDGGNAGQAGTGGIGGAGTGGIGGAGAGGAAGGAAGDGGAAGKSCPPDEDEDLISDDVEGKDKGLDTDKDGTPDYLDLDSDDDTIPDRYEGQIESNGCKIAQDTDGDGVPDFQDTDSDNNGLPDAKEVHPDGSPYTPENPPSDTDGDKYPDYADDDNDNDTLSDVDELVNGLPVDTDGDGLPDLDDPDSDNDGIPDGVEGLGDADGDGIPNFRDLDSDNDGIPDACEAGKNFKPGQLPADSDKDGKYDFLDVDSDNDGLRDDEEDLNKNCEIEFDETDPRDPDTDGDGVSDLIELTLGSDPRQKVVTPATLGKVFFEVPYNRPPNPPSEILAVNLALQRADLAVIVDTTGTMIEELGALKVTLANTFLSINQEIPDVAIGVASHDDYPVAPYGNLAAGDMPLNIPPSGRMTTDVLTSTAALNLFTIGSGGDTPESQVLAMWRSLTNGPYQWPGTVVLADGTVPPDRYGEIAFRKDSLPILIPITDAPFHNGRRVSEPKVLHDPYSFNDAAPFPQPTIDTLVDAIKIQGGRVIGVASDDGARKGDPYEDLAYLADQTNSVAPISAFEGICRTQLAGQPIPVPDGPNGTCRLVFNIKKDGTGLGDRIIDGVKALLKSLVLDVRVMAIPEAPSAANDFVDSVDAFIQSVEVEPSGGEDPTAPGVVCELIPLGKLFDLWSGPKGVLQSGDTLNETISGAKPTTRVCYKVTPRVNTDVEATNKAQVYRATLQVRARANPNAPEINFGPPRELLFVVPPLAQ
jgi:hypothetical protein